MNDNELFKATLNRLGLTYLKASKIVGKSEPTLKKYGSNTECTVNATVWRALLEYEARLHERQEDIARLAESLGATSPPKRKNCPKS